jgi:hypothetical protein
LVTVSITWVGTDSHTVTHCHQARLQIGFTIDFYQAIKTIADHAERGPWRCTDRSSPKKMDAVSQQCSRNGVVNCCIDRSVTKPDRDGIKDRNSTPEH